jgi:hypothetical protein
MPMRRHVVALLAASSLAGLAAPAVAAPGPQGPVTAHAACSRATIGGQSKCIARGQYCARAYARDYRRYGLSCTGVDVRGRYHLQ